MIEYKLNIGDVAISEEPASYTCFGLGSCVGLFVQDRITGLSGGAHIFLPDSEGTGMDQKKFYNVTSALEELLTQFQLRGNQLDSLRAKVTGGADIVRLHYQTGKRNVESVVSHLTARKIFIAAMDVGGGFCRTAKFESKTGKLTVKIPVTNEYKIY
ncbi:MAG: hypothetical protein DI538_20695 [Azospira oryzae]|jgi:chemotaxis protein CheD|nr:MAG: hypothetical protein DI538_20695 [Azospira oryzae]